MNFSWNFSYSRLFGETGGESPFAYASSVSFSFTLLITYVFMYLGFRDPMKRATIKDVINHEWFRIDLPAYLFPPINESEASIVDIGKYFCLKQKNIL